MTRMLSLVRHAFPSFPSRCIPRLQVRAIPFAAWRKGGFAAGGAAHLCNQIHMCPLEVSEMARPGLEPGRAVSDASHPFRGVRPVRVWEAWEGYGGTTVGTTGRLKDVR